MKQRVRQRNGWKKRARPAELEARAIGRVDLGAATASEASPKSSAERHEPIHEQINVWLATDLRLYRREINRPSTDGPLLRVIFKPDA